MNQPRAIVDSVQCDQNDRRAGPDCSRAIVGVMAAIMVIGLVVRLIGLNSDLWYDEVVTLTEFVRLPMPELIRNYDDQNQHPLYSILARISIVTLGESPWTLRLPAVLFGVASLWAVYGFARRFVSQFEALFAALVLAVSYQHVWFSQNARGYTGLLFWATIGSSLFVDNLRQPRLGRTIVYALVMALAMYTHLTAAFIIAAHGVIYLTVWCRSWFANRKEPSSYFPLIGFVLCVLFTLALYSLVLTQVIASFASQKGGIRVQAWTDLSWGARQLMRGFTTGFAGVGGAILGLLVVGCGLVSFARRSPIVIALLLLPCILGLGVMLALNRHLYPRFFFPVLAFGVVVVVRGLMVIIESAVTVARSCFPTSNLANQVRQWAPAGLVAIVAAVSALTLPRVYQLPKQDYTSAINHVRQSRHPEDPVVCVGMAVIPISRYYGPETQPVENVNELDAIRARNSGRPIWLIYTFRDHMASFHPDLLHAIDHTFVCEREFPGTIGGGSVLVCKSKWPVPASITRSSE